MDADILINLTDTDGLYDRDPRKDAGARLLDHVSVISPKMEQAAGDIPGPLGRGGMLSKVRAAKKVMAAGVPMIIANGRKNNILTDLFSGVETGTFFEPKTRKMCGKKRWIAFSVKAKGEITVDDGAAGAVTGRGKSLLASGITAVSGDFTEGAPVVIKNSAGTVIANGLVNYSSDDIRSIMGLKSNQIEKKLGHKPYDEVIHRDNLVVPDPDTCS
jgi:glutamate 5-kinase